MRARVGQLVDGARRRRRRRSPRRRRRRRGRQSAEGDGRRRFKRGTV